MAKPKVKTETFLDFCDKLSPCLVRAAAMKNGRLKTHHEIAKDSGLPARTVQRIASSQSWDGIKVGTASKFLIGCGADIINREWFEEFIQKYADTGFSHMDAKQKKYFFKLMGWPAEDAK